MCIIYTNYKLTVISENLSKVRLLQSLSRNIKRGKNSWSRIVLKSKSPRKTTTLLFHQILI